MLPRPRRNRASPGMRALVAEHRLSPADLVLPLFVQDGEADEPIPSMPGCWRRGIDGTVVAAHEAAALGIRGVALFPRLDEAQKDPVASASTDPDGLVQRTVRALKREVPDLVVITDVAMDPYSSHGHDGLVRDGRIDNDATLPILAAMAVAQARAGADVVAPSDMMDGRVRAIREALDAAGFSEVAICSYCAKYASSFYGPFRDALDSAPRSESGIPGDKRTYQMDPANVREALREAALDEAEGADWLLVKPGLPYLDVVRALRGASTLPIAAYHVSGEYAMLRAAAEREWLDYEACLLESLLAFKRAGADVVFTYGAVDAARALAR
jgi:porphobilinogen synthase